jgi:hypothetical protein
MSLSVDKALRQAQSHLKAGELAEAESLYKQVLSKFPTWAMFLASVSWDKDMDI